MKISWKIGCQWQLKKVLIRDKGMDWLKISLFLFSGYQSGNFRFTGNQFCCRNGVAGLGEAQVWTPGPGDWSVEALSRNGQRGSSVRGLAKEQIDPALLPSLQKGRKVNFIRADFLFLYSLVLITCIMVIHRR